MCNEGKLKVQGGMQLKYRDSSNEVTEVNIQLNNVLNQTLQKNIIVK